MVGLSAMSTNGRVRVTLFVIALLHDESMSPMTATLLSADEYIATGDERSRWTELINGEVLVNNPTIRHQEIVSHLHGELRAWIKSKPGRGRSPGQLDVRFDHENVLSPDVLWASEGRMPADGSHVDFVPELVVEVRSPSTWRYDTTTKFRIYERAGVAEVWLVDTAANSVLVYRRTTPQALIFDVALEVGVGQRLTSPLLEDFDLDITELFER